MATLLTQHNKTKEGINLSNKSLTQRANLWILHGSTGLSSIRIWGHMTNTETEGDTNHYPNDLGDFNRCLLLLEAVPEWRERIIEMSDHGPYWAAICAVWTELTELFLEEVGLNWVHGDKAVRAGALLKQAIDSVPNPQQINYKKYTLNKAP